MVTRTARSRYKQHTTSGGGCTFAFTLRFFDSRAKNDAEEELFSQQFHSVSGAMAMDTDDNDGDLGLEIQSVMLCEVRFLLKILVVYCCLVSIVIVVLWLIAVRT